jgi:hypothetical protein
VGSSRARRTQRRTVERIRLKRGGSVHLGMTASLYSAAKTQAAIHELSIPVYCLAILHDRILGENLLGSKNTEEIRRHVRG